MKTVNLTRTQVLAINQMLIQTRFLKLCSGTMTPEKATEIREFVTDYCENYAKPLREHYTKKR